MKDNIYYNLKKKITALQINFQDSPSAEDFEEFDNLMVEFFNLEELIVDDNILPILNNAKNQINVVKNNPDIEYNLILLRRALTEINKILWNKLQKDGLQ